MTDSYSRYLAQLTNQIVDILAVDRLADEQETTIYELLKGLDCEIIIEKSYIAGVERITNVDVRPKSVNLYHDFQEQADRSFMVVAKLFLGFLYCERFGDSRPLYDALQDYQRVTNYPINLLYSEDSDSMLLQAGMLLEPVLSNVLERYSMDDSKSRLQKMVEKLSVKQWF